MLQNSFIQLPGVGVKKEELLWKKGVLNWDDFILQSAYSKYQAKKNKLLLSDIPNFFSADSWIYKNEPKNWEKYVFKIGTFFCDSFFNKQAFID